MNLGLYARMPTVEREILVPPAVVWDVLTDLEMWPLWGPSVRRAALVRSGPLGLGSRGRVRIPVGVSIPFEITEFVEGVAWAWKVAGVPATRHSVVQTDAGCRVCFGGPIWAPAYLAVCAVALRRIEGLVTSSA